MGAAARPRNSPFDFTSELTGGIQRRTVSICQLFWKADSSSSCCLAEISGLGWQEAWFASPFWVDLAASRRGAPRSCSGSAPRSVRVAILLHDEQRRINTGSRDGPV